MKEWLQGVASETPTCELPANARRMQAAGEKLGAVVRLVYGRCGDLDCGGSVSVRVSVGTLDSAPYGHVGVWHDGKWFSGGMWLDNGPRLGIGYREIMSSLKLAPIVDMAGADTAQMVLDIEAQAA